MRIYATCLTVLLSLLLALSSILVTEISAAKIETIYRTTGLQTANYYILVHPSAPVQNVIFLLPGFGFSAEMFLAEIGLDDLTSRDDILLVIPSPHGQFTHYMDVHSVSLLDEMVAEVEKKFALSPQSGLIVGGYSIGGTGAARFAENYLAGKSATVLALKGLFVVDAPLDFERFWRTEQKTVAANFFPSAVQEAGNMLNIMRQVFGGSPQNAYTGYKNASPYLASQQNGGNAALLQTLPVRFYTEPDSAWWWENRRVAYEDMNAFDIECMAKSLAVFGNDRVEVIRTQNKGYRKNGQRHPHSWSIVDEQDLLTWAIKLFVSS